ncbi:MAG: hypothetical protein WCT18_00885 [Patescibacteria group bacterium]
MLIRIIIGLMVSGIGFLCVKKPEVPLDFIGPIAFAERTFSSGSKAFYKIVGIGLIMLGFLVVTNMYEDFIRGVGRFFFGA